MIKNLCEQFMLSNETLLTKEHGNGRKNKNKKENKKLREKRGRQNLRKLKEEEDARDLKNKSMNPLPINF